MKFNVLKGDAVIATVNGNTWADAAITYLDNRNPGNYRWTSLKANNGRRRLRHKQTKSVVVFERVS